MPSLLVAAASAARRGLLRVLGLAEGAAGGVGLVALARALVERDEAFEYGGRAGLHRERGLVVLDGIAVAAVVFEYGGELEVRVVVVRGDDEILVSLVVLADARGHNAEVVVDDGLAGRELRGLLETLERARVVVREVERVTEVREDVGVFGRDRERAVVGFGRLLVPAEAVVRDAEEVVGLDEAGADLRRRDGQLGDGLLHVAVFEQRAPLRQRVFRDSLDDGYPHLLRLGDCAARVGAHYARAL